jgi:hypothetical protein
MQRLFHVSVALGVPDPASHFFQPPPLKSNL